MFKYIFKFSCIALLMFNFSATVNAHNHEHKTDVILATSNVFPFTYITNGERTGYEVDVVKAIFKKLPEYNLKFQTTSFESILMGLDSNRWQLGINNFAMNETRKQKYIISAPIFKNKFIFVVHQDRNDINTWEDMGGKKTHVESSENVATVTQDFNKSHPNNPIDVRYLSSTTPYQAQLRWVESGVADFQLTEKPMFDSIIKEHNITGLKAVILSDEDSKKISLPYSFILLSKTPENEVLVKKINSTLADLITDGTIAKISAKYFDGENYAPLLEDLDVK